MSIRMVDEHVSSSSQAKNLAPQSHQPVERCVFILRSTLHETELCNRGSSKSSHSVHSYAYLTFSSYPILSYSTRPLDSQFQNPQEKKSQR